MVIKVCLARAEVMEKDGMRNLHLICEIVLGKDDFKGLLL
jgi:hypothetical protein